MKDKKTRSKSKITGLSKIVLECAFDIASKIKAKEVFVIIHSQEDYQILTEQIKKMDAVMAIRNEELYNDTVEKASKVLKVPDVNLTRMGQIKVAIMLALSSKMIEPGDRIVCITGVQDLGVNDSVVVIDTGSEFEIFLSSNLLDISGSVSPDVFETVLNLAMELSTQGRDGRSVGTIFVLGDEEKVLQLSRQLIINPFKGYSEEELSLHDPQFREAVKEFSVIDGAFIVRSDGILITAGRHLNAALEGDNLPQGLGSRHVAAAGITSLSDAIAIVISESTGSVRIFKSGKIFMEIEKPTVRS